jgi:hypothetical protein
MNRPTRLFRLAGIAISLFAPAAALADVPPAMDRCPADAPVIVSIKNVSAFQSSIQTMATTLKLPMDAMAGLGKAKDMLKMQGLNADGSAAVAILSLDQDDEAPPPIVLVVPVKDYASFAKGMGGSGSGLEEVKFEDEPAFIKDLGNGFAAMSPTRDSTEKFAGTAGSGKALESMMGPTGQSIADVSDFFVLGNMKVLAPMMKQGIDEMKNQMQMMAAMGGGNAAGLDMVGAFADGFARDASAGVMGFRATDAGLRLEFGAQFNEGTEFAGYCTAKSKAGSLVGNLPNQAFLFAFGLDSSHPGIKKIATNMAEAAKKDPEAAKAMSGLNPLDSIAKLDQVGFVMGQTPALMGGLFLNTVMVAKTSDPAGYLSTMKTSLSNMNGQAMQGIKYQTSYQSGNTKVGDTAVDTWSMKMGPDPKDTTGQAAQMMQATSMLLGPGGLGGYIAATPSGVVQTYSKNSELMGKALEAAKSGEGLSADPGIKLVSAQLPAERSMEVYLGVKSILETAMGFMAMFGGGPQNFEPPADLPPIGMAATMNAGGARFSTFVPTQVAQTLKTLGDSMNGGGEDDAMDPVPNNGAGQPKF